MARRYGPFHFDRREFLKMAAGTGVSIVSCGLMPDDLVVAANPPPGTLPAGVKLLQSACPYCGVGCGTLIKVEGGKVVGMVPDKKHPSNRGIQCIKGLNAHEPIYKDRMIEKLLDISATSVF